LFKVIEIKDDEIFVEKVFIDGNKIIKHPTIHVPNDSVIPAKYMNEYGLVSHYIYSKDDYYDYDYISHYLLDDLKESINTNDLSILNNHRNKLNIEKYFIDKEHIFIEEGKENNTKEYYSLLRDNIEFFGKDIIDRVGVYEDAIKNSKKLYNEAIETLDEYIEYDEDDEHNQNDGISIDKPDIEQNIEKVTLKDIYRVFRPDSNYSMIKSDTITNWHGTLLNETVRKEIGVGHRVRAALLYNTKTEGDSYYNEHYKIKIYRTTYKYHNERIKKIYTYCHNPHEEPTPWGDKKERLRTIEVIKYPDGKIEQSVKIFKQFNDIAENCLNDYPFTTADDEKQYWIFEETNKETYEDPYEEPDLSDYVGDIRVLYFYLLYKLSDEEYLGLLCQNVQSDEYEDVLINININSVTELSGHDEYVIKGEGFTFTGGGGFTCDEKYIMYPLNYDKIQFRNKMV